MQRAFALLLAAGAAMGLLWIILQAEPKQRPRHLNAGMWVVLGAVLGGRSLHIIIDWSYYRAHFIEIPQLWLGGFSVCGALAGFAIMLFLIAFLGDINPDALLPVITSLSVSLWLGCWSSAYLYGAQTAAVWGFPLRDEWGEIVLRWPLQPVGTLLTILTAWGVDAARARGWIQAPGLAASLAVACFAIIFGAADSLRVDPVPLWRNISPDGWLAFTLAIFAIFSSLLIIINHQRQAVKLV
ncbi:MAG: prolipoprotein diacylglyceryl transferase [Anaerolineales bacterium]|nr:prolipoprotein diacylglyceryl transferase [Anaerolineales bacterium]